MTVPVTDGLKRRPGWMWCRIARPFRSKTASNAGRAEGGQAGCGRAGGGPDRR
ncbi:hypothetical protein SFR_5750 [Streptomyces sp. FR-008]|nr:hypothetical protein SFR_5750 [Streptomyces sp. FR-008]